MLTSGIGGLEPFSTSSHHDSTFPFRLRAIHPPSEEDLLAGNSSSVPERDACLSTFSNHKATTKTTSNETGLLLLSQTPSPDILPDGSTGPLAPPRLPIANPSSPPSAASTHPPQNPRAFQSLSAVCRRLSSGVSDRVPGLPTLTSWATAWALQPASSPAPSSPCPATTADYHADGEHLVTVPKPSPYDITCRTSSKTAASFDVHSSERLPPQRPDCGSSQSCSSGNTTSSSSSSLGWSLRFISFSSHTSSAVVPRERQDATDRATKPAGAMPGAAATSSATSSATAINSYTSSNVKPLEAATGATNCGHPASAAFAADVFTSSATVSVRRITSKCRSTCTDPSTPTQSTRPLPPRPPQPPPQQQSRQNQQNRQNRSEVSREHTSEAAFASDYDAPNEASTINSNDSRDSSSGCCRYSSFQPLSIPGEGLLYLDPSVQQSMSRDAQWSVRQYDIMRKLYEGYASRVCKATCLTSHSDVVLKIYPLMELSEFGRHQVLRELQIHSRLKHPGVVQLLAAFREGAMLVFVLEYVRGGSLAGARCKLEGGRLGEQWAVRLVAVPLLRVLSYMHRQGLVHRDVKPDNMLLTPEWRLKLCDFGVSVDLARERAVTRAGSCEYMAPEVNACPLKVAPADNKTNELVAYGTAVDVWSLGVVLYELLVGFPPYPAGPPPHTSTAQVCSFADVEHVSCSTTATITTTSTTTTNATTKTTTASTAERLTPSTPPTPNKSSTTTRHTTPPPSLSSSSSPTPSPQLTATFSNSSSLNFPASVSPMGRSFITACLQPLPGDRPTVEQLLKHPWLRLAAATGGQQVG